MSHVDQAQRPYDNVRDYGTTSDQAASPPKDYIVSSVEDGVTSDTSSEDEQAGVKAIEAIARTWSPWSLGVAYVG